MDDSERGQINTDAARIYEKFFLPALFAEWPPRVAAAAGIQAGDSVLDVACGTGVLARKVAEIAGPAGWVAGVDINDGMLAVAEEAAPGIGWRKAPAEALPFEDGRFDAVVSQFGIMFFEDRTQAVREMVRVLRPGGRLAVAVWDSLENTPGYARMTALLAQLFGEQAANALRAPFNLGDLEAFRAIFAEAGLPDVQIKTLTGTARFPSIEDWVFTDIKGWSLASMIDEEQYALLLERAGEALKEFEGSGGEVTFASPAHIATLTKK